MPDTAEELKAVAAKLGASSSDIHFGKSATETSVKRSRLADYRVVYFATHGLVAGDVQGLGEPSLALTLPKEPSDLDDGCINVLRVDTRGIPCHYWPELAIPSAGWAR